MGKNEAELYNYSFCRFLIVKYTYYKEALTLLVIEEEVLHWFLSSLVEQPASKDQNLSFPLQVFAVEQDPDLSFSVFVPQDLFSVYETLWAIAPVNCFCSGNPAKLNLSLLHVWDNSLLFTGIARAISLVEFSEQEIITTLTINRKHKFFIAFYILYSKGISDIKATLLVMSYYLVSHLLRILTYA